MNGVNITSKNSPNEATNGQVLIDQLLKLSKLLDIPYAFIAYV